ncbi:MAG: type I pullulanase [Clostridia bacterium]|nr:type I pullulanase [Clostridia bacterium]
MKATYLRIISLLLVIIMLMSFGLTSCKKDDGKDNETNEEGGGLEDSGNEGGSGTSKEPPEDNYTLPKEEGYNQLTFYWVSDDGIENCDIWIWFPDAAGKGYVMQPWGLGGKVVINVPVGITEVGFIVRTDCSDPGGTSWGSATKDGSESDRFVAIEGEETFVYLKSGDPNQYISNDGGLTLTMAKKFSLAEITDFRKIKYTLTPSTTITKDMVKVYEGDREIEVSKIGSGKIIELAEDLDLSKTYRVEIAGFGSKNAIPIGIFDSETFIANYTYDGDDLGAVINGSSTTFKVWAPTASKVVLNLFESGHEGTAYESVEMTKGDKGVWSHTASCGHGTYYTYTVTTSVGTQEAVDPYAKSAGLNGNRGMVVDLSLTDPDGWGAEFSTGIDSYSDAIIWEVHVRDFSNKIASSEYKGKYLAFTERGLTNEYGQPVGVDYLVNLGITHVHLLPVYDYATVDEATPEDEFNWGYDPKNYNVPEGSYSTNPYDGAVRITEYKKMVMALHEAGIGVVMDVVYNHTHDANSSFNKIVPYYYYRYNSTGANTSASGCGNDTASERYMYGKFMVDSVKYWISEYDLDGFRFDLMGLHDLETMQEVEAAVHTIDPEAIIYGEGWTMGATIDGSKMANQSNIKDIEITNNAIGAIAVFNDVIRDGLKGSVFESDSQGYISGKGKANLPKVIFGIKGGDALSQGWIVKDARVVNYMSAHDNNTLWDKLELSNGSDTVERRLAMNRFGATLLMVSKGMTFFQAGEEMLRTKDGDENSYKSSDAINNIDWSVLNEGEMQYEMMLFYKGLIEMRKTFGIFTDNSTTVDYKSIIDGRCSITIKDDEGGEALILSNPTPAEMTFALEGEWYLIVNGEVITLDADTLTSGNVYIPAYSAAVLVNAELMN